MLHRSLIFAALLSLAASAAATTALSHDSSNVLESASSLAEHGNTARAKAAIESLLMTRGVSIGMAGGDGMPDAVAHAIHVWNERLPGSPLHFTSSRGADFTVSFVPGISS